MKHQAKVKNEAVTKNVSVLKKNDQKLLINRYLRLKQQKTNQVNKSKIKYNLKHQ